jgi:uncharacterized membrane protein YebE (DUF533 family)
MNMQNLLSQFAGANQGSQTFTQQGASLADAAGGKGIATSLGSLASNIPGGLAGGAAAGGVMALLMGSKSARKIAKKTATYGGAAVLGGLAYSAFKNWKANNTQGVESTAAAYSEPQKISYQQQASSPGNEGLSGQFQLTLIKAMIAAAKADGHIDAEEQQRIFSAVEQTNLNHEMKSLVFDLLRQPIFIEELAHSAITIEQKAEVYLASCLAINPDHPSEELHLGKLAAALNLPPGLPEELKRHAQQA